MVIQYLGSEEICRYSTPAEAERATGIPSTNVIRCLKGKGHSAGGYIWKYDSQDEPDSPTIEDKKGLVESEYKYRDNGDVELVTLYSYIPSTEDVARDFKIDTSRFKLSQMWVKAKPRGYQLSVLISAKSANDPSTITEERIEKLINSIISTEYKYEPQVQEQGNYVARIILSDIHIGMSVNDGHGMFGGSWGKKELFERLDTVLEKFAKKNEVYKGFKEVHVIDLGDLHDGLGGVTSRGGHQLPQNLTDEDGYETGVEFKLRLLEGLMQITSAKIRCFNITNCNHSPLMDYVINSTVQKVVQAKYGEAVEYNVLRQFLNHYQVGKHVFLLTHGKDSKSMKFGFKAQLDEKARDKVVEYMKHYDLYNKDIVVTLERGDAHQHIIDSASSEDFHSHTYPAFSPASGFVQHCYQKGRSGFNIMVIDPNEDERETTPYFFKWKS